MNINSLGLKVLPLSRWMQDYDDDEGYLELFPVIGRDGYYWSRIYRHCWFESGGRAWYLDDGTHFKWTIDTHLAYPNMSIETAKLLLRTHQGNRFLNKVQLHRLYLVLHRHELRQIRRGL
jgi:hypothetical protein